VPRRYRGEAERGRTGGQGMIHRLPRYVQSTCPRPPRIFNPPGFFLVLDLTRPGSLGSFPPRCLPDPRNHLHIQSSPAHMHNFNFALPDMTCPPSVSLSHFTSLLRHIFYRCATWPHVLSFCAAEHQCKKSWFYARYLLGRGMAR